ncbi:MAG: hypothetical protein KDD67_01915 [Ignavibacteriae bacterium]|nr:hypothetical protein [Ignavibacteriota bacterium]MCB9215425.1 hypothetical protein [Ignavibacteria bacterium]
MAVVRGENVRGKEVSGVEGGEIEMRGEEEGQEVGEVDVRVETEVGILVQKEEKSFRGRLQAEGETNIGGTPMIGVGTIEERESLREWIQSSFGQSAR